MRFRNVHRPNSLGSTGCAYIKVHNPRTCKCRHRIDNPARTIIQQPGARDDTTSNATITNLQCRQAKPGASIFNSIYFQRRDGMFRNALGDAIHSSTMETSAENTEERQQSISDLPKNTPAAVMPIRSDSSPDRSRASLKRNGLAAGLRETERMQYCKRSKIEDTTRLRDFVRMHNIEPFVLDMEKEKKRLEEMMDWHAECFGEWSM